jgi:hypothetical protein
VRWLWLVTSLLFLAGCSQQTFSPTPTRFAVPTTAVSIGDTPPPFDRKRDFGTPDWDIVRGQCDTREIKIEEQAGPAAIDKDGDGCGDDGALIDPYCGLIIYPHCPGRPIAGSELQADHVFSEHAAWLAGAWRWSFAQRRAFSQDRTNLIMTYGSMNESKSDRGPDVWRPPDRTGWCSYARVYRHTAVKYLFAITPAQDSALRDMELTCPRTG